MKKIIVTNWLFFTVISLLALAGGVLLIGYEKPALIYFFSQQRTPALDLFFAFVTRLGEEPVYLITGLLFLFYKPKYAAFIGLIGGLVTGLSFALKSYFSIDRPLSYLRQNSLLEEITLVPGIDVHTGATSFPSGHSMSAFALYTFLILILPNKKRIMFPLLFIATGVAISRVYLVQHFYIDVYAGSLIGVLVAVAFYWMDQKWVLSQDHFLERPVFTWKRKKELGDKA